MLHIVMDLFVIRKIQETRKKAVRKIFRLPY